MITIFNRRELCVEPDPGRFSDIRERLARAGIPTSIIPGEALGRRLCGGGREVLEPLP